MLSAPFSFLGPALLERVLLALNHVLAAEPAATERLVRHAGRHVRLCWQAPPGPWPRPPDLSLRITPAGLVEQLDGDDPASAAPDLRVSVALPAPQRLLAQWLAGERPQVSVEGDAHFAADIAWLAEHLQWDVEHDLARLIGDAPAHELLRVARSAHEAVRRAALGLGDAWSRRPGTRGAASQ